MEKDVKPILVAHTNNFFRRHLTIEKTLLLLLDGHSSRVGYKWLDTAMGQTSRLSNCPPTLLISYNLAIRILT